MKIIFRVGKGVEARIYRDRDDQGCTWSHVGILFDDMVFHAHSGRIVNQNKRLPWFMKSESRYIDGGVINTKLEDFIAISECEYFSIFDVMDLSEENALEIKKWCREKVNNKTNFDTLYNLKDDSSFYCTEFVYKAFKSAGVMLCDEPFSVRSIPYIGEIEVILPGNIAKSRRLMLCAN